jgi:hypothetical protein
VEWLAGRLPDLLRIHDHLARFVAFGVVLLAAEASGYRAALAASPRGPDYMRDRYQRMELFIVPVLQWLACLVIGLTLLVDACRRRIQRSGVGITR